MLEKTTICYVSEQSALGGGEISLLTLLENLPDRIKPVLLAYADGELVTRAIALNIPTRVVARGGILSTFGVIGASVRWMKETGASIVHVNTLDIRAGLAGRLAGIPVVGHLRVIMPFTWVDRAFVRLSEAVISVSDAARRVISGDRSGGQQKICVIPNSVTPPVPDTSLRHELGLGETHTLIGAVGRFDPVKGFEYLIEAIATVHETHPSIRLILIGAPGEAAEQQAYDRMLRSRVRDLGLESVVTFAGQRSGAAALIAGLDILVVPSIPRQTPQGIWEEGFGRVAVEGMCSSVPVVVSRSGGLPEIIEEGVTGKVVPPADSDALAVVINQLAADPDLRARLGREGKRVFAERYTTGRHIDSILGLYDDILGSKGSPK